MNLTVEMKVNVSKRKVMISEKTRKLNNDLAKSYRVETESTTESKMWFGEEKIKVVIAIWEKFSFRQCSHHPQVR